VSENQTASNVKAKQLAFLMNAKLEFPPKNNNGKIGISNSSLREASKENIFSGTKDSLPGVNPVSIVASNQIQMDK